MESANAILKKVNLKCTPAKLRLLSFFMDNIRPVDYSEIKRYFGKSYHKTSLYRTLEQLYERKVLLRFTGIDGVRKYIYNVAPTHSENRHYLFYCSKCKQTASLPMLPGSYYLSLGDKNIESVFLFIEGACEQCRKKEH